MNHKCSRNRECFLVSCNTQVLLTFRNGIVFYGLLAYSLHYYTLCCFWDQCGRSSHYFKNCQCLSRFLWPFCWSFQKMFQTWVSKYEQSTQISPPPFSFWGLALGRAIRKTPGSSLERELLYVMTHSLVISPSTHFSGIFDSETVQYTKSWRITLAL